MVTLQFLGHTMSTKTINAVSYLPSLLLPAHQVKTKSTAKMPKGPISSPPLQPKKVHGVVDDDAPIDDYENAVHEREREEKHRLADEPNVAAARRANKPPVANTETERHRGGTGSVHRSQ
ncbi:hypothetical protein BDW75DRAFT_204635 [Aspergillus navahoensis]